MNSWSSGIRVAFAASVGLAVSAGPAGAQGAPGGQGGEPAAWYAPLKGIPVGSGRLDIGGNARMRFERTDNFTVRGYGTGETDDLLLFRFRLGLDYRPTEHLRARVEFQDARYAMSDLERGLWERNHPFYNTMDLRVANLEWSRIGDRPIALYAGRGPISYADRRVFGPGEWGNVGRYWWDSARLSLGENPARTDLIYGRRVESRPTDWNTTHFPFHMFTVYSRFQPVQADSLNIEPHLFYVARYDNSGDIEGESGEGNEEIHSVGGYVGGTWGRAWDFRGTAVGQFGSYGQDDVRAYGYSLQAAYTWDAAWKPRLSVEYSYASGDRDPEDGKRGTFDGVFGAMDLYYGRMNMFSWSNLENLQLTFGLTPARSLKIWADYHVFRRAETTDAWYWVSGRPTRRDPTAPGREIGQELDVLVQWQATKEFNLFAGASRFFAGEFLRNTEGGSDDATWFFVQGTYQF